MNVLRKLKRFGPVREVARLVDLNFSWFTRLDERLGALEGARQEAAENHACLLQGLSAALENLADLERQHRELAKRHGEILRALTTAAETAARLESRLERSDKCFEAALARFEVRARTTVPDDFELQNPEMLLLQYLYCYLPNRNAVDIGAHTGEVSALLLGSGYEVYAFEPHTPSFERLQARLGGNRSFHPRQLAIGAADATADLLVAADLSGQGRYPDPTLYSSLVSHSLVDGLEFTTKVPVPVRSIESLSRDGDMPEEIGLLKIDTEGYDLEVLRGMGTCRPAAVMAEFWDANMAFGREGALYRLGDLIDEMRLREYWWHIVFHHREASDPVTFYCSLARSEPGSWGNVLFFQDRRVFQEALAWCSATLPRRREDFDLPGTR